MNQQDALLLRAAVSTTACDIAKFSAHRFSSATLWCSSQQGSCMAASPLPGLLSLKQMCFQDKNNTELQIPLRLPLCLYSANSVGTYRLR